MNSPEKVEVPEVQLSFVSGNSVVKPQATHFLAEDAEPQDAAEYYLTETLCLSRTKLTHVAESILKNSTLKYLYLEGNQICSIPASLFISLSNLQWLDLRNNLIVSLPAEIGLHRCLKTLLLEGNPIPELPPELGNVITLKGLNLRDCPLTFPPQDIVYEGLQNILQYLRTAMAKRPVNITKTPPELPMVEKLQLSEMMGSSMEEQDESVDEDDMQRFKELKHKMILLDKAELGSVPQAENKSHVLPLTRSLLVRKKATPRASIIPVLPLSDTVHWKKPEDRRQAAMKELKEKQAILEQRQKSQEALQKWHAKAKMTQEKKILGHKQKIERQRHQEEAETTPGVRNSSYTTQEQDVSMSISECVETRSARELERQIRARVEKMQERCRNPKGTTSEQMAAAEQDVEEMRKLQERLLERKRNWGKDLGNCFTIFTGDTWPSFLDK
ncbi:leucine-rich repeat-containing protein 27 [Mastacembelus armatus]|uniref:Leucine rich repeat containing 27 n=1 Tax=Mastacembelus armatus TaxID=205130 RepID=A0A3Q3S3A5_9TELE|nr:leucine-rich repeat-containing protein 27 [Mastacembelus armatus]XP_026165303.1 leucine-rich repeat-containing protein 27 [Mastacembelus armatus]XP_026165304.1 leucine-rich repeat-containing protein 27 [Mastacembelus armatus]XP_026165305.1 leucine-rich repeat-containing protein 27 [Mastacembelus armatus]